MLSLGVFIALSVFLALIVLNPLRFRTRSVHTVKKLRKGDIEGFLKDIDEDIRESPNEKLTNALLVNKTAGLCYKGLFEEAMIILETVEPATLHASFKPVYYNNLTVVLLELGRFEDARKVFAENSGLFETATKNKDLNNAMRGTLAIYEYHLGDIELAEKIFKELTAENSDDIRASVRYFYLGCIHMKKGLNRQAEEFFAKAAQLGADTYIPSRVDEILKSYSENESQ